LGAVQLLELPQEGQDNPARLRDHGKSSQDFTFGAAPFLKRDCLSNFFFWSGVTFSDWLVSDLSEPADLESTENLAVPVVINFGQQTTTF